MAAQKLDEEAIFNIARKIDSPEVRENYLRQACGDEEALRARVLALLDVHDQEKSFLASPVSALAATLDEPIKERPGTVIGPYKLLEQIGEGGFGVVFMAEQQHPVRRKVALKVLKPGMDTKQVIARFEAERQALALMDHANIARVLEAGETSSGRPYFVMELVRGASITDYCDHHHLSVRERLDLFVAVCQAVQHAHQKGIIHRDIKPSNVLVTLHDGKPVVKVIDFGIAKAMGQERLTDKTLFTNFAQMIGTPLYMSPEQAEMSGLDADTRSDIYSLGVLLYELLTGTTPFDKERLKQAGFDEIRRIIREEEPPKPSTRMSTVGQAATTASEKRQSDPRKLSRLFRGELDWIVMKCLEKDRNRRYETASALAADVQRYLQDEPVQACPPSAGYRFRKFARRNKVALATGLLVSAALVIALVTLVVSNVWVTREQQESVRQRDNAQTQRQLARRAVDKMYTQVAEKWLSEQPHLEPLQREFLEEALRFYQEFSEAQSTDPELRLETGNAYRRVAEIQEKLGDVSKAEEAATRGIALLEQLSADFPREPRYRDVLASCHNKLGCLYRRRNQFEEAEKELQMSLLLHEKLVADDPDVAEYELRLSFSCSGLANVRLGQGRAREAADGYRHALFLLEKLPPDVANRVDCRRHQARCTLDLAWTLAADGRPREAEASCRQTMVLLQKIVKDFPKDAGARHELAWGFWTLHCQLPDKFSAEAETLLHQAVAIECQLADDFPKVADYRRVAAMCQASLGEWLQEHGRFREAADALSQAFDNYGRLVVDHPFLATCGLELVERWLVLRPLVLESGRFDEAEKIFRMTLALAERLAAESPNVHRFRHLVALSQDALGIVLSELSRPQEAEKAFREALRIWSDLVQKNPAQEEYRFWLAWAYNDLADLFATCPAAPYRNPSQAVQLAQKAVELQPQDGAFWNTLGTAHYRAGDYGAAVKELEKAMTMHDGGDCYDWFFLAMAHRRLDHKTEARQLYDRAVAWMEENKPKLEKSKLQAARFRRFRAEAAQLLELPEAPAPATNGATPQKR